MGEGRHLRSFPEHLLLIREQVARVSFWHPLSQDDDQAFIGGRFELGHNGFELVFDHYDFFVEMKDGRNFVFTACTPEWVRQHMQSEEVLSFVDSGLVMVSEITVEAMLDALEKCLDKAPLYGLEHFGILVPQLRVRMRKRIPKPTSKFKVLKRSLVVY